MTLEQEQERLLARRAKIEASGQLTRFAETTPAIDIKAHAEIKYLEHRGSQDLAKSWVDRDRKSIRDLQPAQLRAEEELLKIQRLRTELGARATPQAYVDCRRETWSETWKGQPTPWDERLGQWEGDPWAVTLMGAPGIGKTHLAVATMVEFWRRDPRTIRRSRFVSVPSAVRDIRDAYSAKDGRKIWGRDPADFYRWVARYWDLIIFDDVGAQPNQDNWIKEVSGWIYERHAAQLPTIVTLNPGDYQGLEDRAARRLRDGLVVDLTDVRAPHAKAIDTKKG